MDRRAYLRRLLDDAKVVELRHIDNDGSVSSGLFDDYAELARAVDSVAGSGNTYTTLNAPRDVQPNNTMGSRALCDIDIGHVVRIPFDFDPRRPKGLPASDVEAAAAIRSRSGVVALLSAMGWPTPLLATSGNGAHAVYRCRIPATDELREALALIYAGLKVGHSTSAVAFDTTVRNPARIWRLYGTINRKGTPTCDRPHRLAACVAPPTWQAVQVRQVMALAEHYAKHPPLRRLPAPLSAPQPQRLGEGDLRTLNAPAWFAAHGAYKRQIGPAMHAVHCPWEGEHTVVSGELGTDTVVFENPGRWPDFNCLHDHCEGRRIAHIIALWGDADRYCARKYEPSPVSG